MLQSMTGFGKATGTFNGRKVVVELRALNSKSLDLYIKTPAIYKEKELELRKLIGTELDRGKIEFVISIENTGEASNFTINKGLAKKYYHEINSLANELETDPKELLVAVLRMPEILTSEEKQITEEDWEFLKELTVKAISQLKAFRSQEGASLKQDFSQRIQTIEDLLAQVPAFEQVRIDAVKERMRKALEELDTTKIDENRFEQELIFYIEKLDVSEEKVRLKNHLDYFKETLDAKEAIGKKLGFITQEIGREINTLGSKAQHAELQKIVVNMKDNLEKIKEQVLNTL
jgi:uncharacterized protein (TIGR00255 family)